MPKEHRYTATVTWTGNRGSGTSAYRAYSRDHEISGGAKPVIPGSSDPAFRGDPSRYNPEVLLVASLSSCHMLWMLHLCADAGIVVTEYVDEATGVMTEDQDGAGQFSAVVLHPKIVIRDEAQIEQTRALNDRAHQMCFIARSVNFRVTVDPTVLAG